ncbi:hypothetical protein [Jannaschia sp. 2305UL9-9]|uniref:hypothetical protein n=1 Tax=Jannaschia sp. 2305UL9-9 TaxID=3121638 RepID=UPI0035286180
MGLIVLPSLIAVSLIVSVIVAMMPRGAPALAAVLIILISAALIFFGGGDAAPYEAARVFMRKGSALFAVFSALAVGIAQAVRWQTKNMSVYEYIGTAIACGLVALIAPWFFLYLIEM